MAKFHYKAIDLNGKNVRGSLEAETVEGLISSLKATGLYCLSYSHVEDAVQPNTIGKIPLKELSIICRQFSAMLGAGINIVKCLDVLCQQTSNNKVRKILDSVMQDVRKGYSLHQAMLNQGQAFPFYLISSVESGEESGTLDTVMVRMSDYFEKQYKTREKIRGALTYPIILAILSVAVVILMLTFVVPKFLTMYAGQEADLPAPTKALLAISNFMKNDWWILLTVVLIIIVVVYVFKTLPATRASWDEGMLKMPIIGKMRKTVLTAKFAHTLSTLTSSGISLLVSLEVVSRVINNWYIAQCISIMIDDLKKGISFSQSIRKFTVFPPMLRSMIAIGEESGEMDGLLKKTAAFYDDEADVAIKKMVSMVEPLMIVIMAVIIGFIVIAVITPIYSMYQNML